MNNTYYTDNDMRLFKSVVTVITSHMSNRDLIQMFGSNFAEMVKTLAGKTSCESWCISNDIKYEEMTDSDFEQMYSDLYEF